MSTPDDAEQVTGSEAAEEYAESVGIDPTPAEVEHYLELEGDTPHGGDTPLPEDLADPEGNLPADEAAPTRAEPAQADAAAETPARNDAERMESALRVGGPLAPADPYAASRREAPTELGPGTSLA